MAATDRTPPANLDFTRRLEQEPWRFSFYQALRRLEAAHAERPRIGTARRSGDDLVRLGQEPAMAFPPATVSGFEAGREGRPPWLRVQFLGLLGPNGALPLHLTEFARDRLRNHDDPTFARFLDLFHNRMLALFYRAWAEAQPTVSYDRPETDHFALFIGALFGLGQPALRGRDAMPDGAKLHFAGRLAPHARNPEGLAAILLGFLGMPVAIREFIGHWLTLPANGRLRLGESPVTGTLGLGTVIGARVWDRQSKFRIILGPLSLEQYRRLLPGGETLPRLVAVVRNYVGDELQWDANLVLRREEVPGLRLGRAGQLGWTAWLSSGTPARDADDLHLDPMAYAE